MTGKKRQIKKIKKTKKQRGGAQPKGKPVESVRTKSFSVSSMRRPQTDSSVRTPPVSSVNPMPKSVIGRTSSVSSVNPMPKSVSSGRPELFSGNPPTDIVSPKAVSSVSPVKQPVNIANSPLVSVNSIAQLEQKIIQMSKKSKSTAPIEADYKQEFIPKSTNSSVVKSQIEAEVKNQLELYKASPPEFQRTKEQILESLLTSSKDGTNVFKEHKEVIAEIIKQNNVNAYLKLSEILRENQIIPENANPKAVTLLIKNVVTSQLDEPSEKRTYEQILTGIQTNTQFTHHKELIEKLRQDHIEKVKISVNQFKDALKKKGYKGNILNKKVAFYMEQGYTLQDVEMWAPRYK